MLVRHASAWQGYVYRWNAQGTDANLLSGSATEVLSIVDANSTTRNQTWYYPSASDCTTCHTVAVGHVLRVATRQLNRRFTYSTVPDNQLRSWNHIGLFSTDVGAEDQYDALPDPTDTTQPEAARARAYLAANCANCHRPSGPTGVGLDLRYGIDPAQLQALGVAAATPVGGALSAVLITPFAKEQSDLWERMRRRDTWGMPPLASNVVHQFGVDLVGAWIDGGAGK